MGRLIRRLRILWRLGPRLTWYQYLYGATCTHKGSWYAYYYVGSRGMQTKNEKYFAPAFVYYVRCDRCPADWISPLWSEPFYGPPPWRMRRGECRGWNLGAAEDPRLARFNREFQASR